MADDETLPTDDWLGSLSDHMAIWAQQQQNVAPEVMRHEWTKYFQWLRHPENQSPE